MNASHSFSTCNKQKSFRYLLFLLGFITIIDQVVFIREFISVLSGNELVTGVVMAGWMLLSGWGAYSGRKGNFKSITLKRGILLISALALMPLVLTAVLYGLKYLLFPPGTLISFSTSVIAAFLLLFPVCFPAGYLFTVFSSLLSESQQSNLIGKAYALESAGSLIGGLIFSIILGRFFTTFQIFGITAAIVFFAGAELIGSKQKCFWQFITPGIMLPMLIFIFNPDAFVKKMFFPNQKLILNQTTRYGNLVVTQQAGQLNVYENNKLLSYTQNVMNNEEAVHFAMVQHKKPQQVLLVSGEITGMVKEIEKYSVKNITCLELNPEMFRQLKKLGKTYPDKENVTICRSDIRSFIGKNKQQYDVILLNLPAPSSLSLNRFYTNEFFEALKKRCNGQTVVCTCLPSTENYAEKNAVEVNASLWKTIAPFFRNRLLITGTKNYYLASDESLTSNITEKIKQKGIATEYVNAYYLDDALLALRSKTLISRFSGQVPVNRDFYPFMFIRQIAHWLSHFGTGYPVLVLIPMLLFIFAFSQTEPITAGLFTGGFSAASLEIALLLAYQVYFGSIYLATALFFAVFMAGLRAGSSLPLKNKCPKIKTYAFVQFGLAIFAFALPFLIQITGNIAAWRIPAQLFFFLLIFALSFAVGYEFLLASKLLQKNFSETSAINYSTDLTGSAFGAFLAAIVLLPVTGLTVTCVIVAASDVISGWLAFKKR